FTGCLQFPLAQHDLADPAFRFMPSNNRLCGWAGSTVVSSASIIPPSVAARRKEKCPPFNFAKLWSFLFLYPPFDTREGFPFHAVQ
uniref:Uncharacterized protein n=1 Tax=Salvator merianae TaxID=96440 RepID=A0A8D0KKP3_SALMN